MTTDETSIDSFNAGQPLESEGEELTLALAKKEKVLIVACNWLSGTEATLRCTYTYR